MSTQEPLHLTKTQVFYCKTALEEAAKRYDKEAQPGHAQGCRMLATRLETHQTDRKELTQEQILHWQNRFGACTSQEKAQEVAKEWFHQILSTAPDPVKSFLEAFMPLLDIGRHATAAEILQLLDAKLGDMAAKGYESDQALDEIIEYMRRGQADVKAGRPPWGDDPDVARLLGREQTLPTPPA